MLFTLGKPHKKADGTVNETFFGYCKEDGFKKKKNLGRIEQFDEHNNSKWKVIEDEWLYLFNNKKAVDGKSSTAIVNGKSEWLCEAYVFGLLIRFFHQLLFELFIPHLPIHEFSYITVQLLHPVP